MGIILVLLSLLNSISDPNIKTILISVGCSLIASALVILVTYFILYEKDDIVDVIKLWGLQGIYHRRDKSQRSNPKLENMKTRLDIIAFGVSSLRSAMRTVIEERVRSGVQIRILTISPDSIFLKQQEIDEGCVKGQIRKTNIDLGEWVSGLQKMSKNQDSVQIKYYDALPLDLYFRIDNSLFVGPYLHGIQSQQTITYEYNEHGIAFKEYTDYFEMLWNNETFAKVQIQNSKK
jgi:hypothetical protein